ncbi:MAG: hypothetical protein RLZZ387_2903 [Chloroflexota bacterium]|jgi:hypothetical protein
MRSDDALLLDVLLAARKIARFAAGVDEAAFAASDLVRSANDHFLYAVLKTETYRRVFERSTRVTARQGTLRAHGTNEGGPYGNGPTGADTGGRSA